MGQYKQSIFENKVWELYSYKETLWSFFLHRSSLITVDRRKSACDIVTNVLDCDIVVIEFEHNSYYHVHFPTIIILLFQKSGK